MKTVGLGLEGKKDKEKTTDGNGKLFYSAQYQQERKNAINEEARKHGWKNGLNGGKS